MTDLEALVREWTTPINGQYPRPWMTDLQDPAAARVFIVGRNQATEFRPEVVGRQEYFIDALFNRNGRTNADLYARVRVAEGKGRSRTRANIEKFTAALKRHGVTALLETNVICYSTPQSADLASPEHRGGKERGRRIFAELVAALRPEVLIAHGSSTSKELARVLRTDLPPPPNSKTPEVVTQDVVVETPVLRQMMVVSAPSLAPPGWNGWCASAPDYMDRVAVIVARRLGPSECRSRSSAPRKVGVGMRGNAS